MDIEALATSVEHHIRMLTEAPEHLDICISFEPGERLLGEWCINITIRRWMETFHETTRQYDLNLHEAVDLHEWDNEDERAHVLDGLNEDNAEVAAEFIVKHIDEEIKHHDMIAAVAAQHDVEGPLPLSCVEHIMLDAYVFNALEKHNTDGHHFYVADMVEVAIGVMSRPLSNMITNYTLDEFIIGSALVPYNGQYQPVLTIQIDNGTWDFDGESLHVYNKMLPDALITAAVGRSLGAFIETGTDLDGRIIRDARYMEMMGRHVITILLDPVLVKFTTEG